MVRGLMQAAKSRKMRRTVSASVSLLSASGFCDPYRLGDDVERQDQLEGIIEQSKSAEPCIPSGCPFVRRVDGERDAADFARDGQSPFASGQE